MRRLISVVDLDAKLDDMNLSYEAVERKAREDKDLNLEIEMKERRIVVLELKIWISQKMMEKTNS